MFWYSLSLSTFRLNIQVLDIVQSFNTLAFILVPPDMKIQFAKTWYLEIPFGIVFIKFIVYFDEEISDFRLCYGRFSTTEI